MAEEFPSVLGRRHGEGTVEGARQELAYLKTSLLNGCEY